MCVCPVVIEKEREGRREERRGKEIQICTCRKWGGPWTEPVTSDDTTRPGRQTTTPTTRSQPPRALALPSTHTPDTHPQTATMSLLRTSRLLTTSRARLQIVPNLTAAATRAGSRPFSSTIARSGGDHAHENRYDPPGGWLFGVKPGEQYENEGWEKVWFYGFGGCMAFMVIGYCYKPDTR